ncbi:MAG: hypothetical protein WC523_04660 [Patescibacteria group bacterium]
MQMDNDTIAANTMRPTWPEVKQKLIQLFGGLIMEQDEQGLYIMSLGKVSFWILFTMACAIWIASGGKIIDGNPVRDIPPNMLTVLLTLIGYNIGKKVITATKNILGKTATPEDQE